MSQEWGARPARPGPGSRTHSPGFSLVELLFAIAILATMSVVSVAGVQRAAERYRAVGAVRSVSSLLQRARTLAVSGGANVAVRFADSADGPQVETYTDGNGNGVLSTEIAAGIDPPVSPAVSLNQFGDAGFGLWPGLPSPDGEAMPSGDPIRVGASRMVSFTPNGTATPASVYIRGAGGLQYVIRVYGDTGKTRVLRYARRERGWVPL